MKQDKTGQSEELAIKSASVDSIVSHNKFFITVIGGFVMILLSLISYIYIEGKSDQADFNKRVLLLLENQDRKSSSNEVSNKCIKRYIFLKDGVDINKIEDQQLWDELIKELREKSNNRGAIIKDYLDTIPMSRTYWNYPYFYMPNSARMPLYKNFNSIIIPHRFIFLE